MIAFALTPITSVQQLDVRRAALAAMPVSRLLGIAGLAVARQEEELLAEFGLALTDWAVLRELAEGGDGQPLAAIARSAGLAAATTSAVAARLERAELVQCRRDRAPRVLHLELTEDGRARVAEVGAVLSGPAATMSAALATGGHDTLAHLLVRFLLAAACDPVVAEAAGRTHPDGVERAA
ncbi:DNA-binding MarR family transcriptional regulator [Kineococcus xinjiangensis]|uniref:DNA-binding MarR family transcriptional regulator n=1 Tax=Kineococcus xinjiangensis TaxID=512762 RepID=A0A2S6IW62_9ACTN|nr:MarR family transcriptional regulator [Kineococcus xinjiangensis]PPK98597.1 DNA-binding MarR family transcriptional regulator [Kineococcus xinjiangensis]